MIEKNQIKQEYALIIRLGVKNQISIDEFDWPKLDAIFFFKNVCTHNMFGWLAYHLSQLPTPLKDETFWRQIKYFNIILTKKREQSLAEQDTFIKKMLHIMHTAGFESVIMKGPALQSTIYADTPYVRPFSDLDVLLEKDSALALYEHLLKKEGLRPVGRYAENYESWRIAGEEMAQHLIQLHDGAGVIEVHHRLHQFFMTKHPNVSLILADSHPISTRWGAMNIADDFDMLLMLCYHMYYHHCYENEPRLSLHVDIIYWLAYLQDAYPKDWKELLQRRIREHGLLTEVAYCVLQTRHLYESIGCGNVIPQDAIDMFLDESVYGSIEEIHSRFMLCEDSLGHWEIPYVKRMFMDKRELEREVAYSIYHRLIIEKWEPKLHSLGIYDLAPQEDGHYW